MTDSMFAMTQAITKYCREKEIELRSIIGWCKTEVHLSENDGLIYLCLKELVQEDLTALYINKNPESINSPLIRAFQLSALSSNTWLMRPSTIWPSDEVIKRVGSRVFQMGPDQAVSLCTLFRPYKSQN